MAEPTRRINIWVVVILALALVCGAQLFAIAWEQDHRENADAQP